MHFGFAILIILFADKNQEPFVIKHPYLKHISISICFLGINSYSIYLWHLLVKDLLFSETQSVAFGTTIFFTAAITFGVLSSFLIEKQFIKIRDRYFRRIV